MGDISVWNLALIVLCGVAILGRPTHGQEHEMLPRPLPVKGWSTPSPGWVSPVAPSSLIDMNGNTQAAGQGSSQISSGSSISVTGGGSPAVGWKAVEDPVVSYIYIRDP